MSDAPSYSAGEIELFTAQTKGIRLKIERGKIPVKKCTCIYKGKFYKRDHKCEIHGGK